MLDQISQFAGDFFNLVFYNSDLAFVGCVVIMLGTWELRASTIIKRLADYVVLLALEATLAFVFYVMLGSMRNSMPALFITMALYATLQKRIRISDKIVRCSTFASAFILLTGMTGIFMPAFSELFPFEMASIMPNVVSITALLLIALFLRHFNVSRFSFIPSRFVFLVVAVDLLGAASGYAFMLLPHDFESGLVGTSQSVGQINTLVNVSFLILILIAYWMFYQLSSEHEERTELLVERRAESDNAEMIGVTKSVYESMREMRHETKNQQAYMTALIDAGEYDKLREYLTTFQSDSAALLRYVQTGNTTVDAVVNSKIALANSKGIEVRTMLAVPEELPFREGDVYTLLANLMDNAIEGCEASGADDPTIRLSIRPEGAYYVVSVTNPCKQKRERSGSFDQLKTTKSDSDVHGYGTKIISKIVARYDGEARYSIKDGTFTASLMLAGDEDGSESDA